MTAITSGCPTDRQGSDRQQRSIIEPATDNRNPARCHEFASRRTLDNKLSESNKRFDVRAWAILNLSPWMASGHRH